MGNEHSLTNREHVDLRRVVEAGVERLDRHRRRRNLLVSGAVAVALVAGISVSAFAVGGFRSAPAPIATGSPTGTPLPEVRQPTSTPTPTSSSTTPAPAVTPPVEPPADDPNSSSDPADWIVSDDGVGPFRLGMSVEESAGLLPGARTCRPEGGPYLGLDDRLWLVPKIADPAVVGTIAWLRYNEDSPESARSPRTAEGIGLGSTLAEVQEVYPAAVSVRTNGEFLLVGRVFFDVTHGVVDGIGVTSDSVPWEYCG